MNAEHRHPGTAAGATSPPLLNCPKCRTPLGPEVRFCYGCGVDVTRIRSVDRPGPAPADAVATPRPEP